MIIPLAVAMSGAAPLAAQTPAIPAASGFPSVPQAPAGAPNVIVVMTDDVGFGSSSTFGGGIPTPTLDQLAQNGLRYGNFHTTALCSPSRAALLTGRNHHAVGFGGVAEFARGEEGYNSLIPKSAGTLGQILKANGYSTAWFGKNHNVPTWESGPLGPFDHWPSGLGFDYFYGFNGGHTDQFAPTLVENNNMIDPPSRPGYILERDLADHAIQWLQMQQVQGGGKPFLMYYAPGAAHAPLQAPAEWLAKFRGKFDAGWDVYRQQTFEREKRLGVIPADAKLAPLPPDIKPWDSLDAEHRKVYARYMEAYAAMLAYSDDQMGRIIDHLRQTGQFDNTLIVYIQGDNGATPEGGEHGTLNYEGRNYVARSDPALEFDYARRHIDDIGGPRSYPVGPAAWSAAMNAPFPYYKLFASRLGGISNGMVVSWPRGIAGRGIRRQFTDLIDIVPTILEAAKLTPPKALNGVAQKPFDGVSFAYSFSQPEAPSRHHTQYFEILGQAALYHDGWLAATPVKPLGRPGPPAVLDEQWQLYDLRTDSSQTEDVAAQYPAKLKELRQLFDVEARRNKLLPISNDSLRFLLPQSRPEPAIAPGRYVLLPSGYRYSEGTFPSINNRSWAIDADLDIPKAGGNGVLITQGGRFSGWGLVMLRGVPTFLYRISDAPESLVRLAPDKPLGAGAHKVRVDFAIDGPGLGRGGALRLLVDGQPVAQTHMDHSVAFNFAVEGGSVGHDSGTPVTDDYAVPFAYDGALRSVTVDLQPVQTPGGK